MSWAKLTGNCVMTRWHWRKLIKPSCLIYLCVRLTDRKTMPGDWARDYITELAVHYLELVTLLSLEKESVRLIPKWWWDTSLKRIIVQKTHNDCFKNMQRFNREVVYFSGDSSCSYGESANVMSQQHLSNVSVGKAGWFLCDLKSLFAK